MIIRSQKKFSAIAGLSLGLLATLFGLHMSTAIESSPALLGTLSAIWCAVSASILGSLVNKT